MSNSFPEENEEEDDQELQQPPSHHPSAPPHESFDISTTVDPSYVISLIRKLLPSDAKGGEHDIGSGLIHEELKTVGENEDTTKSIENGGEAEATESSENYGKLDVQEPKNNQNEGVSAGEQTWEECGCILWDLAASEEHAQFMEIGLGIIGNLACHESQRRQITSVNGLVAAIVEQLLLDDVPCLCEACRVLSLCLEGDEGVTWAEALQSDQILSRILWIVENALNPLLIERSVGLILAVLESQQKIAAILLPPLLTLGLSSLLIKLLAFEMSKLKGERVPERYCVLDLILRAIEALSTMDDYSEEICLNNELVQLVKELIKLPDKYEVASSCVTAVVLMANILTDATNLASDLSQDLNFLQGLFDVFPFASDDTEAQSALWSTIARLLTRVQESEMSPLNFEFLVSILASKLDLIEDELLARPLDHLEHKTANTPGTQTDARLIAMKRISNILTHWKSLDDSVKNTKSTEDYRINEEDVDKLLDHCCNASR
ncbi:hypothetical protein ACS0TY_020250 [Phlomoides rotata]